VTGRDEARPSPFPALPFGVTGLPDGSWVVADPEAPGVVRLRDDGGEEPLDCPGTPWIAPMGVAAAAGRLFVSDGGAGHVLGLDLRGGCLVLAAGFERPVALAASAQRLYVVDAPRHEVVVLSLAGERLALLGQDGVLHFPSGAALAPDGSVLVVDSLGFRVVRFGPDGAVAGVVGGREAGLGGLGRPKGVAADGAGNVYVSDAAADLVAVFDAGGAFQFAFGGPGAEPGRFAMPAGLAVSGHRLVVADARNRRVQVFELLGDRS
jgi:DNA-binding beta-propeller fold protein YncE